MPDRFLDAKSSVRHLYNTSSVYYESTCQKTSISNQCACSLGNEACQYEQQCHHHESRRLLPQRLPPSQIRHRREGRMRGSSIDSLVVSEMMPFSESSSCRRLSLGDVCMWQKRYVHPQRAIRNTHLASSIPLRRQILGERRNGRSSICVSSGRGVLMLVGVTPEAGVECRRLRWRGVQPLRAHQ